MDSKETKRRLTRQLQLQLDFVLKAWISAHGPDETKRMILPALAKLFGDEGKPFAPTGLAAGGVPPTALVARDPEVVRLQAENARLRAELTGPSGLVARVDRQTFALGVPLAVDDRNALEALVTSGSQQTAEALGRLLVTRAEREAQADHEAEATRDVTPTGRAQADLAERTRRAQDLLLQASRPAASKGRAQ